MDYGKDLSNVIDVSEMGKNVVQIMQGLIMIGLMFFETTMRVLVSYNVGFGLCIPCLYYCTINKVKDLK